MFHGDACVQIAVGHRAGGPADSLDRRERAPRDKPPAKNRHDERRDAGERDAQKQSPLRAAQLSNVAAHQHRGPACGLNRSFAAALCSVPGTPDLQIGIRSVDDFPARPPDDVIRSPAFAMEEVRRGVWRQLEIEAPSFDRLQRLTHFARVRVELGVDAGEHRSLRLVNDRAPEQQDDEREDQRVPEHQPHAQRIMH
jgi:hypothetical protein